MFTMITRRAFIRLTIPIIDSGNISFYWGCIELFFIFDFLVLTKIILKYLIFLFLSASSFNTFNVELINSLNGVYKRYKILVFKYLLEMLPYNFWKYAHPKF